MEGKTILEMETEEFVSKSSSPRKSKMEGPDGGLAWIVALAAFVINFIMAGLGRMSGILFVAFIEVYGVDRKSASMPFSVKSSAGNLFGPVVGILGQKYGARKIIVIGGVVATISSAACFFAPNVAWITVLWGGISGVGSALIVTLPQVVIGQYFDKYRTTAIGMAFSGGCVGSFVFPVLLEYLIENYGMEGTFLIIGAIIMHTIPAALILKKPHWLKNELQDTNSNLKSSCAMKGNDLVEDKVTPESKYPLYSSEMSEEQMKLNLKSKTDFKLPSECLKSTPEMYAYEAYPDIKYLRENSGLVEKVINYDLKTNYNEVCIMNEIENLSNSLYHTGNKSQYYMNLKQLKPVLSCDIEEGNFHKNTPKNNFNLKRSQSVFPEILIVSDASRTNDESKSLVLNLFKLELDEQKTLSCFPEERNVSRVLTELNEVNKLSTELVPKFKYSEGKENSSKDSNSGADFPSNSFFDLIKTAFKLYVNPLFLMVCLCRAVHFVTFIPAMTTVVDFSIDKGLPEEDGKFAIAAISMGDLLGRLCLGWVTDKGFMSLPRYMMAVMIMQGISTASLPLMNTKVTLFATLALFGLLQGSLFVRHPVLISKYMTSQEQSIAMGCVNFLSGLIGFGLPLYIGFFRDTIGSYDGIFYINGVFGMCVGLLWVFEPFFVRIVNAKRSAQSA